MLKSADRADSNSAVRKDVWVRVPPAAPETPGDFECSASPREPTACIDERGRGPSYAYLLGVYLGDGMLTAGPRNVWRLRIVLDAKYPGIIARAKGAIAEVAVRSTGEAPRAGAVELYSNWKHWICAFPQHGFGRKHLRQIALAGWQSELVAAYPEEFLTGLIHSDGCRFINTVKTYSYPTCAFSNRSPDIRSLFIDACSRIGVATRENSRYDVYVARRDSVALLDRFIGPKA